MIEIILIIATVINLSMLVFLGINLPIWYKAKREKEKADREQQREEYIRMLEAEDQ